jgi:acyl-CoA dehydrogenase
MPPPPFVPEVSHAELTFARVRIPESAVLSGDGYTDYTKAFRTVEDLHVNAAVLGHFLGMALAHGFPKVVADRLVASLLLARGMAALDPKAPETHVALAGMLAEIATLAADLEPCWQLAGDAAKERWYRDRALVQVAGKARETRRERAWQALDEGSK